MSPVWRLRLLPLLLCLPLVVADDGPLEKVVELLEDLQLQIQQEAAKELELFHGHMHFCDVQKRESDRTIKSSKAKVSDLQSSIQEQQGLQKKLTTETAEAAAQVAKDEKEATTAKAVRAKERKVFEKKDNEYVDAVDTINRAIRTLQKKNPHKALLQDGSEASGMFVDSNGDRDLAATVHAVRSRLSSIGSFDGEERAQLDELLSTALTSSSMTDSPSFLQVASSTDSQTEEGSAALIRTLESMKRVATKERDAVQKQEKEDLFSFKKLDYTLRQKVKDGQKAMDAKKQKSSQSQETEAKATSDLDDTQTILADTTKYLKEVKSSCEGKAAEWKVDMASRSDELTAIGEAITILTSESGKAARRVVTPGVFSRDKKPKKKAKGLLQAGDDDDDDESVDETAVLKEAKDEEDAEVPLTDAEVEGTSEDIPEATSDEDAVSDSLSFAQLGSSVSDPFKDVKGMLQDMIEKLLKQAAGEADQNSFCEKEMGKSNEEKKFKEAEIEKLTTRKEQLQAQLSQLADELKEHRRTLIELDRTVATATNQHTKETLQNKKAIKDYADGQIMLRNALQVLNNFYNQGKGKQGKASGVIGLLQIALADFGRLEQEIRTQQSAAEGEYGQLMQDTKISKAVNKKAVEYKSDLRVRTRGQLQHTINDLASVKNEYRAIVDYLDKLKPQCTVKTPTFEERQARRTKEIKSLQDSLKILAGEAI